MVSQNREKLKKKMKVSKNSFDKFQLQYFPDVRRFRMIEKGKIEHGISPQVFKCKRGKKSLANESRQLDLNDVEKGDTWRWHPPKEGGHGDDLLSVRTICGSRIFATKSVRFMSKRDCDPEIFFQGNGPI
ncbi:hypothetical protein PVK06_005262 [Gossypium arboreum]|uniref:Uncharacterized protein n=1 Tax=Gossypium arboreum TaxID=29729 RepID=A0ABR0QU84_GOSAR|nr:hypothetical protein PVK06_005262 [Gossypium arboreum]